jgi:hypothetical protein
MHLIINIVLTILSPIIAFVLNALILEAIYGKSTSGSTDWAFGTISIYFLLPTIGLVIAVIWIPYFFKYIQIMPQNSIILGGDSWEVFLVVFIMSS